MSLHPSVGSLAEPVLVAVCRYESVYAAFTGSVLLISVFRSFLFFGVARRAGTRMHHRMAATVLHAPLAFFHTNPSGRVLNRFSKVRMAEPVSQVPAWLQCLRRLPEALSSRTANGSLPMIRFVYIFFCLQDQGIVDEFLPQVLFDALQSSFAVFGAWSQVSLTCMS